MQCLGRPPTPPRSSSNQIPSVTLGRPLQTNSARHAHGRRVSPGGLGRRPPRRISLCCSFLHLSRSFLFFYERRQVGYVDINQRDKKCDTLQTLYTGYRIIRERQDLARFERTSRRRAAKQETRGQSNLTKSASRGAHSPVRGHPRGSKFVPLNSWGRGSY